MAAWSLRSARSPMAVDVGRHLKRGVTEVPREPRNLRAAFQRALCKGVPEAVKRSLFQRRPDPWNAGANERRIEMAAEHSRWVQETGVVGAGEDEAVTVCAPTFALAESSTRRRALP